MIQHIQYLARLGRGRKVALQISIDVVIIVLCFLLGMAIRLENFEFLKNANIWLPIFISTVVAIASFWTVGLYRTLVRFVSGEILISIAKSVAVFATALFVTGSLLDAGIPRSVPIISGVFLFLAIGGLRFTVRRLFRQPLRVSKQPVVIYGAGDAGVELLNSLSQGRDYAPIAFVEDDRHLQGMTVAGCPVFPPTMIPQLVEEMELKVVLLAMPSLKASRKKEIYSSLEGMNVEVKTIPGLSDIISGKATITQLRNVTAEDLLGRDAVAPSEELLKRDIIHKTVLVTGAGGSIGSELCRQIFAQQPKALILFDISEFAIYAIDAELREMATRQHSPTKIIPLLGSVQNAKRLEAVLRGFGVDTIYHAAAYKHVPLVEENLVEGIRNNVFGTLALAKLAHENNVGSFILISTDKAVRPANVMGATKRISELICQAYAREGSATKFCMVRFGNVLGSSGSVIPRFRSQIEAGGPVTVTHRDINRYFMTIPEASQLVIQAGAMAKGGDVFVLDMGEPVKIADLALTMVKLHGLTPYFVDAPGEANPEKGDIPICFTGLRKGEKLFEELLIGNDPATTEHPRVMTATEVSLSLDELSPVLENLLCACKSFDLPMIQKILQELPLAYTPTEETLSDLVWAAVHRNKGPAPSKSKLQFLE